VAEGVNSNSFSYSFIDVSSIDYTENPDLLIGNFIDYSKITGTEFPETLERLSKRVSILMGRCGEALLYSPLDAGLVLCV